MYYFEAPSVQRHMRRLKNIVDRNITPETIRLSKSIGKIVNSESSDLRGISQRKIYVVDYNRDVERLSKLYQRRSRMERKPTELDSRVLPHIHQASEEIRIEESPAEDYPEDREAPIEESPVQKSKFVKFLRNKRSEAEKRKVYFRSFRSRTQQDI